MESKESTLAASKTTNPRLILFSLILMLLIFFIDLNLPLGVAGGVPYITVILVALWSPNRKLAIILALLCSTLTLAGFYLSPQGGEFWKVVSNRFLALFAIWITAILIVNWKNTEQQVLNLVVKADKEKEKIYLATIFGAQHITNNLLNQLQMVEMEITNHPEFDEHTKIMFKKMLLEADTLMKDLSAVEVIEADSIKQSIYSKTDTGV